MFIYNVTIKVDARIAAPWLQWMLSEHIPEILQTKCFHHYRVVRLLDIDDTEGPTYAIQYEAHQKANNNRYMELYDDKMKKKSNDKWRDQLIAFRSLME